MEKNMETTIMGFYEGYVWIMESKMEATIMGLGFGVCRYVPHASISLCARLRP